jgi:hypothetical protein
MNSYVFRSASTSTEFSFLFWPIFLTSIAFSKDSDDKCY